MFLFGSLIKTAFFCFFVQFIYMQFVHKIALVANSSWNLAHFRAPLIHHFLEQGKEVWAIAPVDDYTAQLERWGVRYLPLRMQAKGMNPWMDLYTLWQLYSYYRKYRFKAVLHFTVKPNLYGSVAARWTGTASVCNVSGLGTVFLHDTPATRVARWMYRRMLPLSDWVFFQNDDDRQLFLQKRLARAERSGVLPGSGIDTRHFALAPLPANRQFVFLLIARALYDKGIVEFVEAARLLRRQYGLQLRAILLGKIADKPGPVDIPREQIEAWVAAGDIEYAGVLDDVRPLIAAADCVVLPSYREGTSRALLEAAAMGRPLIATDVPGCNNIVQEGVNGFLCKPADMHSLAMSMKRMMEQPAQVRAMMGQAARRRVEEHFDVRRVVEAYEEVLSRLNHS